MSNLCAAIWQDQNQVLSGANADFSTKNAHEPSDDVNLLHSQDLAGVVDTEDMILTFENLIGWCERQNFAFRIDREAEQIAVDYRLLDRDCPLLLLPRKERNMLTLALVLPFLVVPERQATAQALLGRFNNDIHMGAWVLDEERGQVYFRVTLPVADNEYTDAGLHLAARVVVSTAEAQAPQIEAAMRKS